MIVSSSISFVSSFSCGSPPHHRVSWIQQNAECLGLRPKSISISLVIRRSSLYHPASALTDALHVSIGTVRPIHRFPCFPTQSTVPADSPSGESSDSLRRGDNVLYFENHSKSPSIFVVEFPPRSPSPYLVPTEWGYSPRSMVQCEE